jgi:hypothetical protein
MKERERGLCMCNRERESEKREKRKKVNKRCLYLFECVKERVRKN